MKLIPLTQGQFAKVDDDDYEWLMKYRWYAWWNRYQYYAVTKIDGKLVYMHRLIMRVGVGQEVDHKNGDGLDNSKENLRVCTTQQNRQNRGPNRGRKYKGVYFAKAMKKYAATIYENGANKHLGFFVSEDDAARAYDAAAKIVFGEFAYLNFPDEK